MAVGLTNAESTAIDGALAGDAEERSRLFTILYTDLRRIAAGIMKKESPGHTLQPTALVHEVYLRWYSHEPPTSSEPAVVLGCALRVMKQVLVDHARGKKAGIRGGDWTRAPLDDTLDEIIKRTSLEVEGLHAALGRLESRESRLRLERKADVELSEIKNLTHALAFDMDQEFGSRSGRKDSEY